MIKSGCEPTLNSLFGEMAGDKMSKREQYEARTEELLLPILNENNFELVDVEYVKDIVKNNTPKIKWLKSYVW